MRKIKKSKLVNNAYFELIEILYGKTIETQKYISDSKKGIETLQNDKVPTVFFQYFENDILIGHMGLISTSKAIAYFGFFEIKSENCFMELWQALIAEAKEQGLKNIFGPVNGTVWHPYRIISESSDEPLFVHEPLSMPNYYELLKNCKPANTVGYHSAFRTNFELILELTKSSLANLPKENIQIIQKEFSTELLREIYDLSIAIFSQNPGYYHLSYEDFLKLYAFDENDNENDTHLIYRVLHMQKPIGFSYNLLHDKQLIMKTIGLLPEWQEKGIGNAMVHEVHKFAQQNKIEKVIYALIRSDNRVKHFPKDDTVIFRKYAAFIYSLS